MRQNKISGFGKLLGLAGILTAGNCLPQPPIPPELNFGNIPAVQTDYSTDSALNEAESLEIWEDELIQGRGNEYEIGLNPENANFPTGLLTGVSDEQAQRPVDIELIKRIQGDENVNYRLRFLDNSISFSDGYEFRIGFQGIEGRGEESPRIFGDVILPIPEHASPIYWVNVRVNRGTREGYFLDDRICNSELGESFGNSPNDCRLPIECYTSEDCGDENPITLNQCINPGMPESYCENPENPDYQRDRLVEWACVNLPRAVDNSATPEDEGTDTRIFRVTPNGDSFSYRENRQIPLNEDEFHSHFIRSGQTNPRSYVAARAGASANATSMTSGNEGYNPSECPDIYIINPKLEPIPEEVWSIETRGTPDITEVIRGSSIAPLE